VRQSYLCISNSSRLCDSELWRFLRTLCKLVVVPALIALAFVELLAWRTGATVAASVATVAQWQHDDPNIVWSGPGQLYGPLALARAKIEHPDILMIGHSRCGQMRSMMFKPYKFHNACVVAWTLGQIKNMIDLATRKNGPTTIIFVLDYFMLGDAYAKEWEGKAFMDFSPPRRSHLDGLLDMALMFKKRPAQMISAMPSYLIHHVDKRDDGSELFGPYAIALQAGFRSDGSLLYDPTTRAQASANNKDLSRILAAVPNGDGVRPGSAQLRALREIGDLGKQRNLTLIGIQLPIIQGAINVLDSDKDWNGYRSADRGNWRLLESHLMRQQLRDIGIHFFNLTHDLIAKDSLAFIDPAHPSEYGMGVVLLDAMNGDPEFRALLPRLDLAALQVDLAKAKAEQQYFDVYGSHF